MDMLKIIMRIKQEYLTLIPFDENKDDNTKKQRINLSILLS